jgi:hypothetical protein
MLTIDEYRQQYQGISSSEVRELISTDIDFRNNTERLYESIYHTKLNKSCSNCWFDAFILIMRTNLEKLKAMQEKQFDLRAGVVLVDPHGDPAKTVTQRNLTDELALYHLRVNPSCIKWFCIYPKNWEQLAVQSGIEAEKKTSPVPETKEPATSDSKPQDSTKGTGVNNIPKPERKPQAKPASKPNNRPRRK